mmetsp:Transcript_12575/g.39008  ORF Transcript_12575/g.39008 Transcript_12575/m.39008 type:complete len:250 (+) Transcript_12575:259-1008(+)
MRRWRGLRWGATSNSRRWWCRARASSTAWSPPQSCQPLWRRWARRRRRRGRAPATPCGSCSRRRVAPGDAAACLATRPGAPPPPRTSAAATARGCANRRSRCLRNGRACTSRAAARRPPSWRSCRQRGLRAGTRPLSGCCSFCWSCALRTASPAANRLPQGRLRASTSRQWTRSASWLSTWSRVPARRRPASPRCHRRSGRSARRRCLRRCSAWQRAGWWPTRTSRAWASTRGPTSAFSPRGPPTSPRR